jgi:hypothetical protein
MKVHPSPNAAVYRATPNGFRQLIADARASEQRQKTVKLTLGNHSVSTAVTPVRPMPGAKPMAVVPKPSPVSINAALMHARAQMHAEAKQRVAERAEAIEVKGRRLDGREIDLICKELLSGAANDAQSERAPGVPPPPQMDSFRPGPPLEGDVVRTAAARARAAIELARRIELFMGSRIPSLELPLPDLLGATVRIEKMGPGEVALTLRGEKGPPKAEAVSRIREAMAERGLKIGALTVG